MIRRLISAVLAAGVWLAMPGFAAKHETWVEVRSPNFIVVSNAGEKQARKTATQFEQIRTLFRSSLAAAGGHPTPIITIVAVKDEKSMSELLPEYWTKGHTHPAGWFAYRMDQFYIVVELDAQGTNPYETVYHEYYHSLTMPYFPNLPTWLSEGLADFFGNSEISGNTATMGRANPLLIEQLRQSKLIPLDVLFKVDHSSPYYNEQNKTSLFYAESWALTHYLFLGDNQSHRQALMAYTDALGHGKSSDEAAAIAFGDLKKLQAGLSNYISKYAFNYIQMKAPSELPPTDLPARSLSDAEVDAYRGGLFAVRGRSQEAMQALEEAVRLDPNLALACRNLALAQFFNNQQTEALVSVNKAVELDPKDGLTRYLRAYLSSRSAGMQDDSQIQDDLRRSIALSPDFAPPYGLLSWYLASQDQNLPEALSLAKKANSLEPGNISYQLDVAQVLLHMHHFDEAQAVVQRAGVGASAQEKDQVEKFMTYLQQYRTHYEGRESALASSEGANTGSVSAGQPSEAGDEKETDATAGVVSQVSCAGGLKIQLDTPEGLRTFRTEPGTPFRITAPTRAQANINPCTSLKGLRVAVQFTPDDSKGMTGTMHQIQILPPEGSSNSSSLSNSLRKQPPLKGPPTVTTTTEGTVKTAQCSGKDLRVTISVRDVDFNLRARDYTRIEIQEDVAFQAGNFDPCTQLSGKDAKITYVMVEKKSYDGEIQAIEVEK
jgi:tetratricopeptide (TPR) repeat protein